MSKSPSRISATRRNAETILSQSRKRQASFKLDQERERDAMMQKTVRLRELRLAKEAAEKEEAASAAATKAAAKTRRSKQA